jgi:hypothetical protein
VGKYLDGEESVDIAAWLHGLGLQQYGQAFCYAGDPRVA